MIIEAQTKSLDWVELDSASLDDEALTIRIDSPIGMLYLKSDRGRMVLGCPQGFCISALRKNVFLIRAIDDESELLDLTHTNRSTEK